MGKIQVINSLVALLYVYKLTVLRQIDEDYLNKLQILIKQFLWDNKKAKIPMEIIQGLKCNGGMGLANTKNKEKALKLRWVFKINSNPNMKNLAYELLENPIGDLIWNTQLNKKHILQLFRYDTFWREVLILWNETCKVMPKTAEEVYDQILWYNSNICINGKPIWRSKMFKKGISQVKDLVTDQGILMSATEMKQKFNLSIPFTELFGIWDAIPLEWKRILKEKKQGEKTNITI